jgi:ribosomal protein L34E
MPYCPKCRFEYKEDIKECPDCGAPLVDELPEERPPESPNFVPLRNMPSRMYAQMLQEALKNEGIPSMIKGDEGVPLRTTTIHIPVSRITIWVPQKDVEKANGIADWMFDHI